MQNQTIPLANQKRPGQTLKVSRIMQIVGSEALRQCNSLARRKGSDCLRRSHLDTATIPPEAEHASDREPSPARSAFDCRGNVESACTPFCVRGRCEPGTARGPGVVEMHPPGSGASGHY